MGLLSIFTFGFSLFILWNTLSELIHVRLGANIGNSEHDVKESMDDLDDIAEDETLEISKEVELAGLIPTTLINLGWMGFVCYIVRTSLSGILFKAAILLFAAEFIIVLQAALTGTGGNDDDHDFIAIGLYFAELYFAFSYIVYCLDGAYRFLSSLLH